MEKTIAIAGKTVASIETDKPWIILVACPVFEALAILITGSYLVAV